MESEKWKEVNAKSEKRSGVTFGELIEVLGERLGTEIEDAGGAAAVEVDGEVVILAGIAAAWRRILSDSRSGAVRPEEPPIGSESFLQV